MPFGHNEPMKIPLPLAPSPYFQIRDGKWHGNCGGNSAKDDTSPYPQAVCDYIVQLQLTSVKSTPVRFAILRLTWQSIAPLSSTPLKSVP